MEFQWSYFKSWKMMLWKCCTQYVSKFGKLSSGHRTGKGQFSFQSQRKAMPKNAQTITQLHSSHTLVKWCSKFSNKWIVNFQMFKLVLEKAEKPEIKLPTSTGSWKKQASSRKTSISATFSMLANLENSTVATGLEKGSFHANPKENQCQRIFKRPFNCTHLIC